MGRDPSDFTALILTIQTAKLRLKNRGLTSGKITCPWCHTKGSLQVAVAPKNGHMRGKCITPGCGCAFIE